MIYFVPFHYITVVALPHKRLRIMIDGQTGPQHFPAARPQQAQGFKLIEKQTEKSIPANGFSAPH